MTNTELYDALTEPTQSDVIRLARECGYPMDNQLHIFIVKVCELCHWDTSETFRRIFNERPLV